MPNLCQEPEGLRRCLEGWDFGDPSEGLDSKLHGAGPGSRSGAIAEESHKGMMTDDNGYVTNGKGKANARRRWLPVQTAGDVSEALQVEQR